MARDNTCRRGSKGDVDYIIGEIDVPRLDDDRSPISPFDLSRSMRLNPSNELVRAIYAFIGQSVEQVRRELVGRERQRRQGQEARHLAEIGRASFRERV